MPDNEQYDDEKFVTYLIKSLVNSPEKVEVERIIDDRGVFITVKVAKEDTGLIIGKGGQNIAAVRILLKILAARSNQRIALKVLD